MAEVRKVRIEPLEVKKLAGRGVAAYLGWRLDIRHIQRLSEADTTSEDQLLAADDIVIVVSILEMLVYEDIMLDVALTAARLKLGLEFEDDGGDIKTFKNHLTDLLMRKQEMSETVAKNTVLMLFPDGLNFVHSKPKEA